jgi:Holliday junction resolvase RusA-like endonuclease
MAGWGFVTIGTPATQGSHRGFVNPKTGRVIVTQDSAKTRPWRALIVDAAPSSAPCLDAPVAVHIVFTLPRPKAAPRAERVPYKKPDLDKLERAAFDAVVSAGLLSDDCRVAEVVRSAKVWTGYDPDALRVPGMLLAAEEMTDPDWRYRLGVRVVALRAEPWGSNVVSPVPESQLALDV